MLRAAIRLGGRAWLGAANFRRTTIKLSEEALRSVDRGWGQPLGYGFRGALADRHRWGKAIQMVPWSLAPVLYARDQARAESLGGPLSAARGAEQAHAHGAASGDDGIQFRSG